MLKTTVEKINEQGKEYKKYTNEWNVMQQLIDIISLYPESAEIVYQDLQTEEMALPALVNKVIKARIADPCEVMKEICEFYKIPCPEELPPETWRNNSGAGIQKEPLSLIDLL